jgi:hypothetical protein
MDDWMKIRIEAKMTTLNQMTKLIPLGQITLSDRKEHFLPNKANFFMDDPIA